MKRKRLTIGLIIVAFLIVVGLITFRFAWIGIHGQQELSGTQAIIPERADTFTTIQKGEADWPTSPS